MTETLRNIESQLYSLPYNLYFFYLEVCNENTVTLCGHDWNYNPWENNIFVCGLLRHDHSRLLSENELFLNYETVL